MAFTAITAGQVDADSPIDTTLMDTIRTNLDDLDARFPVTSIGDGAVSTEAKLASSVVSQTKLKTTTGTVSASSASYVDLTLPGGEYGFYPRVYGSVGDVTYSAMIASAISNTSAVANIALKNSSGGGRTTYAIQRYIQASPPYKIGDKVWGHFLFLLRKITTGEVVSAYEAEDPPWAYNGAVWLPKDHADRLAEVPHPFADYWLKDPAIDGLEIVLVDLTARNVKKVKEDNAKLGKGLLEDIPSLIAGKGTAKAQSDYLLPNIPRFTDKVKIYEP